MKYLHKFYSKFIHNSVEFYDESVNPYSYSTIFLTAFQGKFDFYFFTIYSINLIPDKIFKKNFIIAATFLKSIIIIILSLVVILSLFLKTYQRNT